MITLPLALADVHQAIYFCVLEEGFVETFSVERIVGNNRYIKASHTVPMFNFGELNHGRAAKMK